MNDRRVSYERLIAYAAGDLDSAAADFVRGHLEQSLEAAAVVERFRTVVETLRADDSQAPPADVMARAKALFADRRVAATPSLLETAIRVIAELVHDSRLRALSASDGSQPAPLAGVRGAATAYQLTFESERADVDLEVEPEEIGGSSLLRISGQITPRDEADVIRTVAFVAPGTTEIASTIKPDQHGVFSLTIASGKYDLLITVSDTQVVLPNVEIG